MDKKQKHFEMIQGVINRLSQNSFLLKGWSVILVSALFALAANNTNPAFIFLAYFPALAFWILDGYYLWQERLFRALYDYVRGLDNEDIDFSMNTSVVSKSVDSWPCVIVSKTLLIFHLAAVLGAITIVAAIMIIQICGGLCNAS